MTIPAHANPSRRRENPWAWVWAWVWVVCVGLADSQLPPQSFPDFPGPYCRTRVPDQCCRNRFDPCSVPIDGTLCYCDEFCIRPTGSDCCPDYFEVCRGVTRPTSPPPLRDSCTAADGTKVPQGYSYKNNCNLCKCDNGRLECEQDVCMVDPVLIERVNRNPGMGWTATNYTMFWGRKASEGFTYKTGTQQPEVTSSRMYPILLRPQAIPKQFDARTKREWRNFISDVSDQEWCGSSWAFSTLGVAQDRVAIETYGKEKVVLSPQHLVSCDQLGQSGCEGGHIEFAWQFLRRTGTVEDSCFPYVSGVNGDVPPCPTEGRSRSVQCVTNTVMSREDIYRLEPSYRISGKEQDIQWEIMQNGPVQAIMNVYRDFFLYREGIYSYTGLEGSGGGGPSLHSVRLLGWGEENGSKYWLCANSWGRDWGENGYFRIRRGTNESDIETFILAVRANFNSGRLRQYRIKNKEGLKNRRRGRRALKHYHSNHNHHHSSNHL